MKTYDTILKLDERISLTSDKIFDFFFPKFLKLIFCQNLKKNRKQKNTCGAKIYCKQPFFYIYL